MAEPVFQPQPGDAAAKTTGQRARQGQNIKGMVWVLAISTLLVVGAFAIMLALRAEPSSVVNESRTEAASSPVQDQFPSSQPQQSEMTPATPSN